MSWKKNLENNWGTTKTTLNELEEKENLWKVDQVSYNFFNTLLIFK